MKGVILFALISLAAASSIKRPTQRIAGGTATTVNQYPMAAAILTSADLSNFVQSCGGVIINNRSVLTSSFCLISLSTAQVKIRIGSSLASSGGFIHNAAELILYPFENYVTEADVALFRSATFFVFSDVVAPSNIAGANYVVPDNAILLTYGWGNNANGEKSDQLQQLLVNAINQEVCKSRYPASIPILDSHICSGILNVGGSSQCEGDGGGPLFHLNTIVGITSFVLGCGDDYYPNVNTRVSSFTEFIVNNA